MFKKILFAIIFSLAFYNIALGAKVEITSDEFIVDEDISNAIFKGNVIIRQPDLTVWAEKVIVTYGENGPSDLKSFEAIGKVKIKQPEQTASANRGIYDPKTKILTLLGNVVVTNDSGTITGEKLIIDTISGVSKFPTQKNGGRVTAIFSQ